MTIHTRLFGHRLLLSFLSVCVAMAISTSADETQSPATKASIIDFRDPASVESHRPILVAHRGGIVGDDAPECSLTALRRAAKFGFDMVELDVRVSGDGKPVLFHDRTLKNACGRDGSVGDYKLSELEAIPYKRSHDRIASLDTALRLCGELKLGVMLDLKSGSESSDFLLQLKQLLIKHRLMHSTITFSGTKEARQTLTEIRFTPTANELRRLRAGERLDLSHRFWFGLPNQLTANDIKKLQSAKALVLPAINTFRYAGQDHMVFAQKDVLRLTQQGVDGFQIDSVYFEMVKNSSISAGKASSESIHLPQKRISD